MSNQYVAEIRIFSYQTPPKGWAQCNGQLMSIQQNAALFSILGTTYGGNGVQTFALPNLQGRVPLGFGTGGGGTYAQGEVSGEVNHTLLLPELATHTHTPLAGNTANNHLPAGLLPGLNPVDKTGAAVKPYAATQNTNLNPLASQPLGGNQPHSNMAPYLTLNYCIATVGIFPSRN